MVAGPLLPLKQPCLLLNRAALRQEFVEDSVDVCAEAGIPLEKLGKLCFLEKHCKQHYLPQNVCSLRQILWLQIMML